jgi:hypothetical protein
LRAFPTAEELLALPDEAFAMPAARRETLRALARAVAAGQLDLDPAADRVEVAARLTAVAGIGPWTAGYVALRGIGDPDVFLPTDLAVRRGAAALGLPDEPAALDQRAARWRPWRSYAVVRIWAAGAGGGRSGTAASGGGGRPGAATGADDRRPGSAAAHGDGRSGTATGAGGRRSGAAVSAGRGRTAAGAGGGRPGNTAAPRRGAGTRSEHASPAVAGGRKDQQS